MSSQNQNPLFSQDSLDSDGLILYDRSVEGFLTEEIGDYYDQKNFCDLLWEKLVREDTDPSHVYFIRRLAKIFEKSREVYVSRQEKKASFVSRLENASTE